MFVRRVRRLLFLSGSILGVWLAFGALMVWNFATSPLAGAFGMFDAVWMIGLQVLSWALVTPIGIYAAGALVSRNTIRSRLVHVALLAALAPVAVGIQAVMLQTVFRPSFVRDVRETTLLTFFTTLCVNVFPLLGIGTAAYCAAARRTNDEQRRAAAELLSETSRVQLQQLQAQLEPHFLFNTLNCIAALIDEDPSRAQVTLRQLSDLLERSLRWESETEIQLHDEIEFIRRYLEIQTLRFGDRLKSRIEVSPLAEHALVPPLILQPLVENAVVHGILKFNSRGTISVNAGIRGDDLLLEVHDSGPGFAAGGGLPEGIGISNTRSRLQLLYGQRQALAFARESAGFVARIALPVRRVQPV